MSDNQPYYKDYFKDVLRSAEFINYLLFLVFFIFTLYNLFALTFYLIEGLGQSKIITHYINNLSAYWAVTFLFLCLAIFEPINKNKHSLYGARLFKITTFVIVMTWIVLFIFVSSSFIGTDNSINPIILMTVTIIVAVSGWFVNHQIAADNRRRGHTLNLLLQTRLSSEFQENSRLVWETYPRALYPTIPEDNVRCFFSHDKEERKKLDGSKIKAVYAQIYLLNYYEFLAYGIISKNLDNELLYQTIGGILEGTLVKSKFILRYKIKQQPKAYEHVKALHKKWDKRLRYEESKLSQKVNDNTPETKD